MSDETESDASAVIGPNIAEKRAMSDEPRIEINGVILTLAQAGTMRTALEHFASSLNEEGLGDDVHGEAMTRLYLERIEEIRSAMFESPGEQNGCSSTLSA